MPAEQLEEAITYAAAEVADGTVEHAELAGRIDVRDDLAAIGVSTLVISTTDDHLAPPPCTAGSPRTSPAPGS
ncbi:hypothetical protein ACFCZQ_33335 [Streptomyces virginiae]|uniref:hypothetical protein n=1 Tax=Streptomyces virginiae TaxID=1961 RepID=UPI0035D82CB3